MVEKLDDWPWSSWQCTIGNSQSPDWLATDAILRCFGTQRASAINAYIEFFYQGLHKRNWDKLKHQIHLGDDDFVKKYQALQSMLDGNLSEVPLKQRRPIAKPLSEYQQRVQPEMRKSSTPIVRAAIPKSK